MSKRLYDLAVKTGEYQDREGNTKANWQNIGVLMEGDDGNKFIMLERWFNPAGVPFKEGSRSILVSCFEPREQDGQQQRAPAARAGATAPRSQPGAVPGRAGNGRQKPVEEELDDTIPF
jgi:hypothetical protein